MLTLLPCGLACYLGIYGGLEDASVLVGKLGSAGQPQAHTHVLTHTHTHTHTHLAVTPDGWTTDSSRRRAQDGLRFPVSLSLLRSPVCLQTSVSVSQPVVGRTPAVALHSSKVLLRCAVIMNAGCVLKRR